MRTKQICPSCGSTKLRERTRRQVGEIGCKDCDWYGDLVDTIFPSNLKLEYRVAIRFRLTNKRTDQTVEALVGRMSDGSGYSFFDGTRDMDWWYKRRDAAVNVFNKLKDARLKPTLEVQDANTAWPLIDPDTGESYAKVYFAQPFERYAIL